MKVVFCKSFLTCWGWNVNAVLSDMPDDCLRCTCPLLSQKLLLALQCFIAPLLSSFPLSVGFQLQWAKSTYLQGEKVRPSFRALGERPAYFLISLWCNSPSFNGLTFPWSNAFADESDCMPFKSTRQGQELPWGLLQHRICNTNLLYQRTYLLFQYS